MSNTVRQDVIKPIMDRLFEVIEKKCRDNPESPMWIENTDYKYFQNKVTKAAILKCANKVDFNDLRTMAEEDLILLEDEIEMDSSDEVYGSCNKCCENFVGKDFFKAIINTRNFMNSAQLSGLGTFLRNFANITHGNLQGYGISNILVWHCLALA